MAPPDKDEPGFIDSEVEIGGWMVRVKPIIGALLVLGLGFFVFQNTQDVQVRWLFFTFTMRLWVLTVVLVVCGMLVGWALHRRRQRRRS